MLIHLTYLQNIQKTYKMFEQLQFGWYLVTKKSGFVHTSTCHVNKKTSHHVYITFTIFITKTKRWRFCNDNSLIVNEHSRLSTHVGSGSIDSVPLTVQGVVRFRCCLYEQIITNLRPEKMLSLFITTEIYLYLWVNEMSDRSEYSIEQDLSELGTKLN